MYAPQMMPRERTPASRLASGLMPTASVSTPRALRRSTKATTATIKSDQQRVEAAQELEAEEAKISSVDIVT